MPRKRNGARISFNPEKMCVTVGDIDIYDLEEFLYLPLRWVDTNVISNYAEKEVMWDRIVTPIGYNRMYEWEQEHIDNYFENHATMYLPTKHYNRILRGIAA